MLFFVDSGRNVLITQSNLPVSKAAFHLTELDVYIHVIVTGTNVRPNPAIQIHSSVGGLNYINVFGEEPVQISLKGMVAGSDCTNANQLQSALGISVDMFVELGVVQRVIPLQYRVGSSRMRAAYLVGMDISQDDSFNDVATFQMTLLAEPLAEIEDPRPVAANTRPGQPTFADAQPVRQTITAAPQAVNIIQQVTPSPNGQAIITSSPGLGVRLELLQPNNTTNYSMVRTATLNTTSRVASRSRVNLALRGTNTAANLSSVATTDLLPSGDTSATRVVPITATGFDPVNSGSPNND